MAKLNNGKRQRGNSNRTLYQLHVKLSALNESIQPHLSAFKNCRSPQNTAVSTANSALPLWCPVSVTHTVASKFQALVSAKKFSVVGAVDVVNHATPFLE